MSGEAMARPGVQPLGWGSGPVLCALAAFAVLAARAGGAPLEDDAYYYLVIARNLAATGVSTFDLQSQTNGYHPLWLGLLALKDLSLGPSLRAVGLLQALLLAGGAGLILRAAPKTQGLVQIGFTALFIVLIGRIGLGGMEVALFAFCFGAFVSAMTGKGGNAVGRGLTLGLAAAACVGARLDSALFILPALAAAPVNTRMRRWAFAVVAALGLAYAAGDLAVFGVAAPVSSSIKSLGGLQINRPLIAQLGGAFQPGSHALFYLLTLAALIASPALIHVSQPRTAARALAWASSVGGLLYVAKLLFLSSWVLWPWYNFAILFPITAAYLGLAPSATAWLEREGRIVEAPGTLIIVLAGMAGLLIVAPGWPTKNNTGFAAIDRLAVQRFGGVLNGARVAMGDRAGAFAAAYPGPVVQLEGLVNDKTYLEAIRRGADVRPLLCQRGVRYVLAFERPLGVYDRFQIRPLRPVSTQAAGPMLDVWRQDEVGQVRDLGLYDNHSNQGGDDSTLYIWRLRCALLMGS